MHEDGHMLYDFGCKIEDECTLLQQSRHPQKRLDITVDLCEECCHGDLCNMDTCVNSTDTEGLACYSCAVEGNPHDCHTITRCRSNQMCYAEKFITDSPHPLHTLGCLSTEICHVINSGAQSLLGKRSDSVMRSKRVTHLCQSCCNTAGCNVELCDSDEVSTISRPSERTTNPISYTTSMYVSTTTHPPTTTSIDDVFQIRLVGGGSPREGRVELYLPSQWGTVCDDRFDDNAAAVICHTLGYPRTGAKAWGKAHFGQGKGPIWLDEVYCEGHENSLLDCSHRPLGDSNCDHSEDAGVTCYVPSCMPGSVQFGNSCYIFNPVDKVRSFSEAQGECEKLGATMVTVDNIDVRNFLVDQLQNLTDPTGEWLTGGKRHGNEWVWEKTGQTVNITVIDWGRGEPNNSGNCLSLWKNHDYRFADVWCSGSPRNFICEKSPS
ncbi:scavenger receptor cysteine-rich type 1 protein M130-like [Liolophura sinensis]|uniref:scavenger receptor cysteine-rich type 1 protein M130-like n=1 Tax=Liolophura sinensis TaxID=3198878 RepID=UPI0031591AAB